jgi:hypothetical protein
MTIVLMPGIDCYLLLTLDRCRGSITLKMIGGSKVPTKGAGVGLRVNRNKT